MTLIQLLMKYDERPDLVYMYDHIKDVAYTLYFDFNIINYDTYYHFQYLFREILRCA